MNLSLPQISQRALEKFQAYPHVGKKDGRPMTSEEIAHYTDSVRDGFSRAESTVQIATNSRSGHAHQELPTRKEESYNSGFSSSISQGGETDTWADPGNHRFLQVDTNWRHSISDLNGGGSSGFVSGGHDISHSVQFGVETPAYIAGMKIQDSELMWGKPSAQVTSFLIDQKHPEKSLIFEGALFSDR